MTKFKLSILTLLTVFVTSSIFISCSNDEDELDTTSLIDNQLITRLSNFNNEHSTFDKNGNKCDGFWSCVGYVTQIAGADIVGAATGVVGVSQAAGALAATGIGAGAGGAVLVGAGVICGGGASYAAARTYDPTYNPKNTKYSNINLDIPEYFSFLSNVGIEHNNVIHNNFYNNSVENYYRNFNHDQIQILKSPEFKKCISRVNIASENYTKSNFDYKKLTQKMLEYKYITKNMKLVLDLFMFEYFLITNTEDIKSIVNFYIESVSSSRLTELEKKSLIASFIVASESPFYFLEQ